MNWLLVAAGAAVGAPLRYLTDRLVQSRHDTVFPWGTLAVNVLACLVLGLITGALGADTVSEEVRPAAGAGLCGALSTYSTFSYETLRLAGSGAGLLAVVNVIASVGAGIGALVAGTALAGVLWG